MMYPYITLYDETEIVHSHIINEDDVEKVLVHFERPTADGFKSARCELPTYKWLYNEGFSIDEITFFEEFLQNNAHLLYKYARSGGIKIA